MLITRSQGAACRRAAERIARGEWSRVLISDLCTDGALGNIGWTRDDQGQDNYFDRLQDRLYDQSQVLTALLWCAELGKRGEPREE